MPGPIGLVLAGGAGRRLGRTKGDLRLAGRPLAVRAAAVLRRVCQSVLISVRPGSTNPAPTYPAVMDAPPGGRGPLAGIDAAFEITGRADLLVLACDYPRVDAGLLARLVESAREGDDIVLPRDGAGQDHPLVALWRRQVRARVNDALRQGRYRVTDLVEACEARRLGPESFPRIDLSARLVNVNRLEDLQGFDEWS
jgi:molybdopterin-guanine dinucleotide biosynthesis protein A